MVVLDVWALAVLVGCALIARRHARERSWTLALIGAAVAVAALLGESVMVGQPASLASAVLLTGPALLGVFVILPYLSVIAALVEVGPRITARARPLAARAWLWALLGWVVWTVLLSPTIVSQVLH